MSLVDFNLEFLEEYIDTSRRCTRPRELRDSVVAHVSQLGFDKISALNILETPSVIRGSEVQSEGFFRIGTYPSIWFERFFEKAYYEVDPVSLRTQSATIPFYWSDCYNEHNGDVEQRDATSQFRSEAGELELIRGITIPIDNKNIRSCISFCGREAINNTGVMHMMHLIGIYFHQRLLVLEKACARGGPNSKVSLTPRENEVLEWYAHGKSAWDISVLLSVSEAAVRFHMTNIRRKYGVSSSVHATALAISRNDIQI